MDPCRSSSLCSLCFLLSYRTENNIQPGTDAILIAQLEDEDHLCPPKHIYTLTLSFLNSSYSGLSVGNSSRQSGQELVCDCKHEKGSKGILNSHSHFSITCLKFWITNLSALPCPTRAVYILSGKGVCKAFLEPSLVPRTQANTQDTWDLCLWEQKARLNPSLCPSESKISPSAIFNFFLYICWMSVKKKIIMNVKHFILLEQMSVTCLLWRNDDHSEGLNSSFGSRRRKTLVPVWQVERPRVK